tara:strand:- start:819 stop:2114 length:1296 start_codon:yes stop_codon:yes gene_type:complete
MRIAIFLTSLFLELIGHSQSLPIDFETTINTSDFVDFDGGIASVLENPQVEGINTSTHVAKIIRSNGAIWAGSKIALQDNLDFSTSNSISMKVYTTAPVGTIVKFKLEGAAGAAERDVEITVSSQWEVLTWDFTGEPSNFNFIVFMFDFGNVGDGSATSTFLFDDIEQWFGGTQIDLPLDFEGTSVNYTMTDFGGNESFLADDPMNSENKVMQVIKTSTAATWAGTTLGTPSGFATPIPLSLTDSKITVKVWSPAAGTPIRLKVEDANDPTHTCETETNTTVTEEWEVLTFDFVDQAPGTEFLSIGLERGWIYNMASIFFNFGTEGATAGAKTYYFDEVKFYESMGGTTDDKETILSLMSPSMMIYPNPAQDRIHILMSEFKEAIIYTLSGKSVFRTKEKLIDLMTMSEGIYVIQLENNIGAKEQFRLIKN